MGLKDPQEYLRPPGVAPKDDKNDPRANESSQIHSLYIFFKMQFPKLVFKHLRVISWRYPMLMGLAGLARARASKRFPQGILDSPKTPLHKIYHFGVKKLKF